MKAILDAIKTRLYLQTALTTALSSRIYLDTAPADAQLPLLVYAPVAPASTTQHFGGVVRYDMTVTFQIIYTNAGTDSIYTIASAIETAMSTTMTATGYDRVTAVKQSSSAPSFADDAWSITETYRLTAFDI